MTPSHLKTRLTSSWMRGGFTLNLSVVAFSCHLVISTFHINYLHLSRSHFLLLGNTIQCLVRGFRKAVTADSTQGTLFMYS